MSSIVNHYESHLAPIYIWMAGGLDYAVKLGESDIAEFLNRPGHAIDLGAGFGMHTIPLAKSGYSVIAVDSSKLLLEELKRQCTGLNVQVVNTNLLEFDYYIQSSANLILCLGDTLTHLQTLEEIEMLINRVKSNLNKGGSFIATFRDYTHLPKDYNRFIPVRSDPNRILTCFLEEQVDHIVVNDILHERKDDVWTMKISNYKKLRLSPDHLVKISLKIGLNSTIKQGPRGMLYFHAVR